MTFDPENITESILESLGRIDYIKVDEIPSIDLYVDQVTTFMEKNLKKTKRYESDKIMTKTMINNYAKNDLLPPPVKKKYSPEHLIMLIYIYYFKGILSMDDIYKLLHPMIKNSFGNPDASPSMAEIYKEVFERSLPAQVDDLKDFVKKKTDLIKKEAFTKAKGTEADYLKLFSFICTLSFDVYVKKLMIEKLIDLMPEEE
ncbi:MAG: DUF1836 domain-containing protein [Lachnospiraceae bacterium]|nr:DUF1836 domain-containing protein [Lachnospiraceae bacterium]